MLVRCQRFDVGCRSFARLCCPRARSRWALSSCFEHCGASISGGKASGRHHARPLPLLAQSSAVSSIQTSSYGYLGSRSVRALTSRRRGRLPPHRERRAWRYVMSSLGCYCCYLPHSGPFLQIEASPSPWVLTRIRSRCVSSFAALSPLP